MTAGQRMATEPKRDQILTPREVALRNKLRKVFALLRRADRIKARAARELKKLEGER